jgi:predicted transcriptional regulator
MDLQKRLDEANKHAEELEQRFSELTEKIQSQDKRLKELAQAAVDNRTPDQKIRDLADEIYSEAKSTISYSEALNIASQRAPKLFKQFAEDYRRNF